MKKRLHHAVVAILAFLILCHLAESSAESTAPQTGQSLPAPVKNRSPLQPNSFYLLPLTSVRPTGWLRRQLQIQAAGLTGHLDEFWPDLGPNSGWLGGTGESWERGPYFMDGLVPLAYLLDDPGLIAKARKWVEWTLSHASENGWIGPKKNADWWPNMVMLKVLTQYQEASGDPRVIPLLQRYFKYHVEQIKQKPLREWAIFRWYEELQSVLWLYNRTGDPQLLELARGLQTQGFDWKAHFKKFEFTSRTDRNELGLKPGVLPTKAMSAHGVNNAMAMKATGLWWLVSGDPTDRNGIYQMLKQLETITVCLTACLVPTNITRDQTPPREWNCAQWWRLCIPWKTWSPSLVIRPWRKDWRRSPSTPYQPLSLPICGPTNTINNPIRYCVLCIHANGPPTVLNRTFSGLNPIMVAARPICTKDGPS
jgi:hypothetical protein